MDGVEITSLNAHLQYETDILIDLNYSVCYVMLSAASECACMSRF